jgi:hypothetical protein
MAIRRFSALARSLRFTRTPEGRTSRRRLPGGPWTLEASIAMGVMAAGAVGWLTLTADNNTDIRLQSTGVEIAEVLNAAQAYGGANYQTLQARPSPYAVTVQDLIDSRTLSWSAPHTNPFGQAYGIVFRADRTFDGNANGTPCATDAAERCPVTFAVVTQPSATSTTLNFRQAARIAEVAAPRAGKVVGRIIDSAGIKLTRIPNYDNVNLTSYYSATGGPTFSGGTDSAGYYLVAMGSIGVQSITSPSMSRYSTGIPGDNVTYQPYVFSASGGTVTVSGTGIAAGPAATVTVGSGTSITAASVSSPNVTIGGTSLGQSEAAAITSFKTAQSVGGTCASATDIVARNATGTGIIYCDSTTSKWTSVASGSSGSTNVPLTSLKWDTPGTYAWIVPAGLSYINEIHLVGGGGGGGGFGGGGGGGGGYAYYQSYPVVPGQSIPIVVGSGGDIGSVGTASSFAASIFAYGGGAGQYYGGVNSAGGGSFGGITGHSGGSGGASQCLNCSGGGGGGAAGYSGNGGNGVSGVGGGGYNVAGGGGGGYGGRPEDKAPGTPGGGGGAAVGATTGGNGGTAGSGGGVGGLGSNSALSSASGGSSASGSTGGQALPNGLSSAGGVYTVTGGGGGAFGGGGGGAGYYGNGGRGGPGVAIIQFGGP